MKKIWYAIISVLVLDIITKMGLVFLITGTVPLAGNAWSIIPFPYIIYQVTSFFNIVFTWNPGTSFSLFRQIGESAPMILVGLTAIIIGFLAYYTFYRAKDYEKLPMALIVGGALGNLIDRCRFGAVIDFLDFHAFGYHWPSFNVADIAICIGVALFIINTVFKRKK